MKINLGKCGGGMKKQSFRPWKDWERYCGEHDCIRCGGGRRQAQPAGSRLRLCFW